MTATFPEATFPIGIPSAGQGIVVFVPSIADPDEGVTMAELAAGTNFSCAIDGWDPQFEPGTRTTSRYCSSDTFETKGKGKYTGPTIRYVWDPTTDPDVANPEYPHLSKLLPDANGFMVDFRGFDAQNGPYPTTGDNIAKIYTVTLGEREPVAIQSSEDDDHKLEQKVYFSGAVFSNKKVLA